jgi:flagellar biosynthesis regulator FlaF
MSFAAAGKAEGGKPIAGVTIMAEPTESTPGIDDAQPSIERAKMILTELANAAQSAALSVVDEQKARTTVQIGGLAEALRAAAQAFDRSRSPIAAHYADTAARQVEALAASIRNRPWTELVADLEQMARRRPATFVAGAVALGFIVGRFLSAASRRESPSPSAMARAVEGTVAAAVASGAGNSELTGWPTTAAREPELP